MSLAEEIREFVTNRYLGGSPLGYRLLKAADDIETLERHWPNPQLERDGSTSWEETP